MATGWLCRPSEATVKTHTICSWIRMSPMSPLWRGLTMIFCCAACQSTWNLSPSVLKTRISFLVIYLPAQMVAEIFEKGMVESLPCTEVMGQFFFLGTLALTQCVSSNLESREGNMVLYEIMTLGHLIICLWLYKLNTALGNDPCVSPTGVPCLLNTSIALLDQSLILSFLPCYFWSFCLLGFWWLSIDSNWEAPTPNRKKWNSTVGSPSLRKSWDTWPGGRSNQIFPSYVSRVHSLSPRILVVHIRILKE